MVNQGLVDYLKEGKRRGFTVARLKQELIRGGFNLLDIDEAISYVSGETIKPKNTLIVQQTPKVPIQTQKPFVVQEQKSGKGWIIFLIVLILILIGAGVALYFYWDSFVGLFG